MTSTHTLKLREIASAIALEADGIPTVSDEQRISSLNQAADLMDELQGALAEMVAAHSMQNVGVGASKRRLAAIAKARSVLAKVETQES